MILLIGTVKIRLVHPRNPTQARPLLHPPTPAPYTTTFIRELPTFTSPQPSGISISSSSSSAEPGPSSSTASSTGVVSGTTTTSSAVILTAAGGDGGDDGDDSDDDGEDNSNNRGPSSRSRQSNSRYRGNNRYSGMRRTHAAFHYDPATFVHVTDIGNLERHCPHCDALAFPNERRGICCNSGKVFAHVPAPPPLLLELANGSHQYSQHYLRYIMQFNGLFQFTSFAADIQFMSDNHGNRAWNPNFKVLGQVYHRIGSLFPSSGQLTKFMQIYFLSQSEQLSRRRSIFDGLNPELIQLLTAMMNTENPYVAQFKSAVSTIQHSSTRSLKVRSNMYSTA